MLIRMECGLDIPDKILKYDGRPFFYNELLSKVIEKCVDTSPDPAIEFRGSSS
jgi:2-oxoglutarate ferredoxin oxidoreductase subunit alpha